MTYTIMADMSRAKRHLVQVKCTLLERCQNGVAASLKNADIVTSQTGSGGGSGVLSMQAAAR